MYVILLKEVPVELKTKFNIGDLLYCKGTAYPTVIRVDRITITPFRETPEKQTTIRVVYTQIDEQGNELGFFEEAITGKLNITQDAPVPVSTPPVQATV